MGGVELGARVSALAHHSTTVYFLPCHLLHFQKAWGVKIWEKVVGEGNLLNLEWGGWHR